MLVQSCLDAFLAAIVEVKDSLVISYPIIMKLLYNEHLSTRFVPIKYWLSSYRGLRAVSYTHLTLPTILRV